MTAPAPSSAVEAQSLDSLAIGVVARVAGLAPLPSQMEARLLELGFDEGAEVEALHRAFLGDPIAVRIDGATVALRRALARAVLVTR